MSCVEFNESSFYLEVNKYKLSVLIYIIFPIAICVFKKTLLLLH